MDNPRRRQNVTRQMATEAALKAKGSRRVFIWFDNSRDGWAWDFEGSEWLGHRSGSYSSFYSNRSGKALTAPVIEVKDG